jgi:ParB-like chromosome segregation protein Spo0J
MDLPPLDPEHFDRLKDDIRHRGVRIPILLDGKTGEEIDGKLRQQIAQELGIRDIPTIFVSMLSSDERDDLRLAVNLYRRHLTRAQMRELIAWGKVFDDAIVSHDRDKTYHAHQQPLSEALFYIGALTGPRSTICDPFPGSGTIACAVARLGQGRRFSGAEVDLQTCAIARSRVAEEVHTGTSPSAKVAMAR